MLGPLLFTFYINSITAVPLTDGTLSLFADDLMLYRAIRSPIDFDALQVDINNLCTWTDDNMLTFNETKCKYMLISRRKQPVQPTSPIMIKESHMERVHSYRYLGVWLTSTLSWSLHVAETCKKARRQLGFLYRKFYRNANNSTLLQLYLAYVRPHLEYAAAVWDPHQQGHINSLERVQKLALKMCTKDWNTDYNSLMETCNVPAYTGLLKTLSKTMFLVQYP